MKTEGNGGSTKRTKPVVLVIDEDKDFAGRLKEDLARDRELYTLRFTQDGKSALKAVLEERVDLVILDTAIPVSNGKSFLRELHSRKVWTPVIATTAHGAIDQEECERYGIIEYMAKPIDSERIRERIRNVLAWKCKEYVVTGISLATVLQLLEMEKKTGMMDIENTKVDGRIFFRQGRLVDIELHNPREGVSLEELLAHEDVKITMRYLPHNRKQTILKSVMEILIEAAVKRDEKYRPGNGFVPITEPQPATLNLLVIGPDQDLRNHFIEKVVRVGNNGGSGARTMGDLGEVRFSDSLTVRLLGISSMKHFAPFWLSLAQRANGFIVLANGPADDETALYASRLLKGQTALQGMILKLTDGTKAGKTEIIDGLTVAECACDSRDDLERLFKGFAGPGASVDRSGFLKDFFPETQNDNVL